MTGSILRMRLHVAGAASAGLAVRLYFILRFPFRASGDTFFYEQLARNWLDHRVYGLYIAGRLVPVDMRAPGYPAFLVAVYTLFGRSQLAVMLSQAVVDLATCFLVAALAAVCAPRESRRRVAFAALWLAALCPLTANYTATVLTETLATFLTALALLILAKAMLGEAPPIFSGGTSRTLPAWFAAGLIVGFGTLVRPETPLVLLAAGLVLLARWWRPQGWSRLLRAGAAMGLGLLLPLLPWAARNARTLHEAQFLAPRYSQLPGEYVPHGFYAWTGTWLWRFRDVYLVPWRLDDEPINMDEVPAAAFDSPEERERVAGLVESYNDTTTISPDVDAGFAELARERTARHPLRTYISVPLKRAAAMWFTPRIEMLPFTGLYWPPGEMWEEDPVDYSVTLGFGLLNFLYAGLALAGAWVARRRPVVAFLIVFILLRTAFLTHVETPEPRYVLECFPALLALGALLWSRPQ
jgi:4-amino-4-deoxy-L-arabinose transferase-like glycosyltransferase